MNQYIVMKVTRQRKHQHSAIFKDMNSGQTMHIGGNLPDLYNGMIIGLVVQNGTAVDYHLELTDRNLSCLRRYKIDEERYARTLEAHQRVKDRGITWYAASLNGDTDSENVYECLPFPEADRVHKEMVNNPTDAKRLKALNRETLEIARCCHRKIAYGIEEYLGYFSEAEREGAYQQLMLQLKILCLQAESYSYREGRIWDNEMKQKEDFIRLNIEQRSEHDYGLLSGDEIRAFVDGLQDSVLCGEQKEALWTLDTSFPCIITGGAGCGKTTVIKAVIDCYAKYYGKKNILLVAPTGKASRRLAEKTHLPAMTIHRALRKTPDDDFVFYTAQNPLPHSLVIVDESSMIDTALMYDLLSAVRQNAKIIFVGDHNQLYPVGYGEPFFDFLNTLGEKNCVYRLKENHRQDEGTDILSAADDALNGRRLHSGRGVIVRDIDFADMPSLFSLDDNTQIISPYNDLNLQINSYLRKGEDELNVGDKVIALKNTENYCNGDIGYITGKDDRKCSLTIDFEGRSVTVTRAHKQDISLAYSITIHKMQGSEAERIIVFLPKRDRFVDKRMMYTAVTRARKQLEIYYY